ncbi:MAG: sulfate ABC transporter substrate-binding protein [Planctomycetes bacterium]|nr:sulfate ABC transporter substrate-binding protein [Planctomycetota bacterium]
MVMVSMLLLSAGCDSQTAATSSGGASNGGKQDVELLNVCNDPTRELWKEINQVFTAKYQQEHGAKLSIKQSHGGSSSQARAVIDGLEADVVALGLWPDTDQLRKKGLIAEDWEERLPNHSLPFTSTIVFVVRKGNPKKITDWPDIVKPGVEVITPNPKTSGNGRLSFLAAWGSVILQGGTAEKAQAFVTELYRHAPVLDTGARGSTITFAQKGIGDVHLTWENEARLEVEESKGELEVVFPSISILADPPVAVVDANVDRKGTRAAAQAYLEFLYTPEGQAIFAKHYYRPIDEKVCAEHQSRFPEIKRFPITEIVSNWDEAQTKFFSDGGVFDSIYQPQAGRN